MQPSKILWPARFLCTWLWSKKFETPNFCRSISLIEHTVTPLNNIFFEITLCVNACENFLTNNYNWMLRWPVYWVKYKKWKLNKFSWGQWVRFVISIFTKGCNKRLNIYVMHFVPFRETYERQKLDVKALTRDHQTTKRALESKVSWLSKNCCYDWVY